MIGTHGRVVQVSVVLAFLASLVSSSSSQLTAQSGVDSLRAAPPRFADPDRPAKLAKAVPEIEKLFREFVERSHAPGLAYAILVDGEPIHTGTTGFRDVRTKAPVRKDTVFRIASMTKSFTAMAILKLRDAGKLSLDDPAEKYVPEMAHLPYPTSDSPRITIRHLLSHSAGFPEDNPWGDQQLSATDADLTAMIAAGIPFSNAPGVAYEYSNFGFAILGRVVSRASGMPYRDYVASNILQPLGMKMTTMEPAAVAPDRLAHGYRWEDETWKDERLLPDGAFGSMGGMLTSVEDLSRYVGFLMSAWPPRDGPETGPVSRASAREMQQVWRSIPATVTERSAGGPLNLTAGGYAFGLRFTQTCEYGQVVSHGGGLPGFGSHMRWLPEYGVGMITMTNLTYTGASGVVDRAIDALRRTGGLKPRVPQPAPVLLAAKDDVSRLIVKWDDELAGRVAAMNLFLDESADRRRRRFEDLAKRHGACRPDQSLDAENALRGEWTMTCDRGSLRVGITLSPTVPPRVQELNVRSIMPMADRMRLVVSRVAGWIGSASSVPVAEIMAPSADTAAVAAMLAASSTRGSCRIGDVVAGDGVQATTVRLACDRGEMDLAVVLDEATGKAARITLAPAGYDACR
ncbi:MAG: serine hydrolase domain-containing protein [Vicinamibacterales bacterium]